jgi:hypothetical protein
VRNNQRFWVLLLGLIVLLLSFVINSCGLGGYTTYKNEKAGYSISYPLSWSSQVSEDGKILFMQSKSRLASVRIDVFDVMTAQQAAQRWIIAMGTGSLDFALLENKPMEGLWNWYLSYDYEASTGMFHGEAYFKTTAEHTYKLDTAGDMENYETYPFPKIVSSFKLK